MKIKIPIQALRIDIITQTFETVQLQPENVLNQLYQLLACHTISGFDLDGYHCCYIDDEGLLGEPEGYFTLPEFSYPIASNAIIVGTNHRNGNDKSVKPDLLEKLRNRIIFFRPGEVKLEIRFFE
ncbi:MAG: hypothetical protein H7Y04_04365 [Verrucomicrobia bacterium]|nr:hypothetical protein [Cytophagales bacterium]